MEINDNPSNKQTFKRDNSSKILEIPQKFDNNNKKSYVVSFESFNESKYPNKVKFK